MADWRLDQKTEETPQGTDLSLLVRGSSVFKTTFQKIKDFVIGTNVMGTEAEDVTGAVAELKGKIDSNSASLKENTKDIEGLQTVIKYGENQTTKILASVSGASIKDMNGENFLDLFASALNLKDMNVRVLRTNDDLHLKATGEVRLMTDRNTGVCISNNDGNAFMPIAASAFNVGSKEEYKDNIKEINADLDLLKNSKIYEYNLKEEEKQGIKQKHYGFVIDRETPKEILSPNGDTIDIYSLVSLLWRQNQELLERITILENSVMELGNLINKEEVK